MAGRKYGPVRPKVTAASAGTAFGGALAGLLIYLLDVIFYGGFDKGADVPAPVSGFVIIAVPAALGFLGGWLQSEPDVKREGDILP